MYPNLTVCDYVSVIYLYYVVDIDCWHKILNRAGVQCCASREIANREVECAQVGISHFLGFAFSTFPFCPMSPHNFFFLFLFFMADQHILL